MELGWEASQGTRRLVRQLLNRIAVLHQGAETQIQWRLSSNGGRGKVARSLHFSSLLEHLGTF